MQLQDNTPIEFPEKLGFLLFESARLKTSGVYYIFNKLNGKIYIGSSINIKRRFTDHEYFLKNNKHHSILLQRAWNNHWFPEEIFEFKILEFCKKDRLVLLEREQFWLDLTQCFNPNLGYNISPTAGSPLGFKKSEATKLRHSLAIKGIKRSAETRAKMSASRKGVKIHSEESKLKISLAGKNRSPISEETRLKLSKTSKGRKLSENAKANMRLAAKKRGVSEKTREALRKYRDECKLKKECGLN